MGVGNTFLAQLGDELELLRPHLRRVALKSGQVLCEPGERLRLVYFLESGAVSKLTVFADGSEIEGALIGREGAVGATAALGLTTAATRDVCHLIATAMTIGVAQLADAAAGSPRVRALLDSYCAFKMIQSIRNGACNARHPVEPRLCRWLLTCSDVLESEDIRLPQDLFAKMLGAQRTSVNPILRRFQALGLIALGRARLTLLDRPGLEARACECYRELAKYEALLRINDPPIAGASGGFGMRARRG